jgi:hypothetical protein
MTLLCSSVWQDSGGLLLGEMRFAVRDELVDCRKHLPVRRVGHGVQQPDELPMRLVDQPAVEHQAVVPLHYRHRVSFMTTRILADP